MMKKLLISAALLLVSASTTFALEVGDDAPCVVLEHAQPDGTMSEHCIREPEFANKPVILDFFSISCSYCIQSFPELNQLSANKATSATFRSIALDRNEAQVLDFIKTRQDLIKHEVALDSSRNASKAYGIQYTPTIYILNAKNKVVYKHIGLVDKSVAAEMSAVIDAEQ